MEYITCTWKFLCNTVFFPIGNAFVTLYTNVLKPFWDSFVQWVKMIFPWTEKFADFCMKLFKFKYMSRIYSFMIILPIAFLIMIISLILSGGKRGRISRKIKRTLKAQKRREKRRGNYVQNI